jgi:hypothetical protein
MSDAGRVYTRRHLAEAIWDAAWMSMSAPWTLKSEEFVVS